ncbi:HD domain-containing protein [Candidatus Woesebacteria bacterium]|nr:HD domain-containing protein [Candidatus Woesebacteria bacterium]
MNSQINLLTLTAASLKEKRYLAELPEYYALESVVENNPWHDHQNVLDHVIKVYAAIEQLLKFEERADSQKTFLHSYFSRTIGNHSKKEILCGAALLHDIAKIDTLVTTVDGNSYCPGHELIGASRVHKFSERLGLDAVSTGYVEKIVRYHGFISEILNYILTYGNKQKYFELFSETVGNVALELVLHLQADIHGCDLERLDKTGFDQRIEILDWMLDQLISKYQ